MSPPISVMVSVAPTCAHDSGNSKANAVDVDNHEEFEGMVDELSKAPFLNNKVTVMVDFETVKTCCPERRGNVSTCLCCRKNLVTDRKLERQSLR